METPSPSLPEPPVIADFDALTRAARQERCLSENTLLAYQRAWRRLLAWSGASKLDPVTLTQEQAARFYGEMVATTGAQPPAATRGTMDALGGSLPALRGSRAVVGTSRERP